MPHSTLSQKPRIRCITPSCAQEARPRPTLRMRGRSDGPIDRCDVPSPSRPRSENAVRRGRPTRRRSARRARRPARAAGVHHVRSIVDPLLVMARSLVRPRTSSWAPPVSPPMTTSMSKRPPASRPSPSPCRRIVRTTRQRQNAGGRQRPRPSTLRHGIAPALRSRAVPRCRSVRVDRVTEPVGSAGGAMSP